jgi:hypothetical protein
MEDKMLKNTKADVCCTSHRCEILGIIFLAIATILTLLTFSGVGILGMFIVGLVFCCHKHWGCTRCNCKGSSCSTEIECDMHDPKIKKETSAKKTTPKK